MTKRPKFIKKLCIMTILVAAINLDSQLLITKLTFSFINEKFI